MRLGIPAGLHEEEGKVKKNGQSHTKLEKGEGKEGRQQVEEKEEEKEGKDEKREE